MPTLPSFVTEARDRIEPRQEIPTRRTSERCGACTTWTGEADQYLGNVDTRFFSDPGLDSNLKLQAKWNALRNNAWQVQSRGTACSGSWVGESCEFVSTAGTPGWKRRCRVTANVCWPG